MSPIMVTVLTWFLSPIIRFLLPKIFVCPGFDPSDKLLELEIHIIPELKKTTRTVDQERMMQREKRVKTDLDALDKMAAMLRHALEDAEDIFDDAQHKIVLRCWHRLFRAFATCRSSICVQTTSAWIMQCVRKIMSWSRHKIVLRCFHRLYGAFSACIALCKCCCVSIACVVRTKSACLLQGARKISLSLFLRCRPEESVAVNVSPAMISDEPVQVIINIQASGGEPGPMTTNAEASGNEIVPVTTGVAVSDEPDPVTASIIAVASSDETVPVTPGAAASDEPDPVTTSSNSSSGRWLSCLCSSLDFFKNWFGHVFEAACFYRDWSYQVLGIKICQENASLFDILDMFLTAISRMKLKKRIQKVENTVTEVKKSPLLGVASNITPDDIANKNRSKIRAASKREVFGREVLRDDIMAMLRETPQGDAPMSSSCYSVIGIYGIAGSGKTTFAGYIRDYINEECKEDKLFDTIMCIHVSETFTVEVIFQEMLKDITGDSHSSISDHGVLNKKLKEELHGKRFFLILDDLWVKNKNDQQLEELISPLNVGLKGSKILVTARTREAAGALCVDELIEMPDLAEDQYMKMFMHYALRGKGIAAKEFEQVGREIAKKLHRSPIAAVAVAGRLGANPNISFWKNVAKLDMLNDTMDALWWSYQKLNPDIRRCFEFCNIFPRRFKLKKDDLVHLWIAQGFVNTSCATEDMEDVAEVYIQELVSSSFLQRERPSLSDDDFFTIHDLLHDLSNKVAGTDCFRIENKRGHRREGWTGDVPRDVRHLFVEKYNAELITKKILGLENLRTLIIYDVETDMPFEEKVINGICMRLAKLRVLAIALKQKYYRSLLYWPSPNNKFLLPESIIQLKHLRYLAFPTSLRCKVILPSALAKLLHIQLLDFSGGNISEFNFADLTNLRHIFCEDARFPHIGRLSSLQEIPHVFIVRNEEGYEIKQLRDLNKLRGKLHIEGLGNVKSKEEALEANLAGKEKLRVLILWFSDHIERCTAEVAAEVLDGLCPPVGLESLSILDYNGARYPGWMVGRLNGGAKDLQRLGFYQCGQVGPGPELEAFPHLRILTLWICSWDALPGNMEHLTSLQTLRINECKNIRSLPTLPKSLKELVLHCCNDELMKGCQTKGDPNWLKIKHIPMKDFKPCFTSSALGMPFLLGQDREGKVHCIVYKVEIIYVRP